MCSSDGCKVNCVLQEMSCFESHKSPSLNIITYREDLDALQRLGSLLIIAGDINQGM